MALPASPRTVVTGAGGGLGRAFCRELLRRGASVVASDVDLGAVEKLAAELGERVHPLNCDVSRVEDVEELARRSGEILGGVDLVINNAGVAVAGLVGDVPIQDWQWIVGINFWGVVHGCHVFAPLLRQQHSGHILNVASLAGLVSAPNMSPYNATKAAVVALSEALRSELVDDGVGVSVLCPTFFQTNISNAARIHTNNGSMHNMIRQLMASAKVQADDVARIALDGVARGDLYILPHTDGRVMWLIKRLFPHSFSRMTPKLLALRARRA